jgi:NTE family protein
MEHIECYAVFEGGGIKGLAFAGALEAAENAGIKFVGYAGASAGAVIAFLASLGYSGKEIFDEVKNLDFDKFATGDVKQKIHNVKRIITDVSKIDMVNPQRGILPKIHYGLKVKSYIPVRKMISDLFYIYKKLDNDRGLYDKSRLIYLLAKLAEVKVDLKDKFTIDGKLFPSITFKELYAVTKKELKVIATDVLTGRVVEFSYDETPDACVFQALAASSSYPIFFEPSSYKSYYLVDGGLSCNLPTYVFHKKKHKRLPVYAFDLINTAEKNVSLSGYNIQSHLSNLLSAGLDASNNIISNVVGGISVPIPVPLGITTLKFDLSTDKLNKLYDSGYNSTKAFFVNHKITNYFLKVTNKHDVGKLLYGKYDNLLDLFLSYLPNYGATTKAWLYTSINANDHEIISIAKTSKPIFSFNKATIIVANPRKYNVPYFFKYGSVSDHSFSLVGIDEKKNTNYCVTTWFKKAPTISFDHRQTRICIPISSNNGEILISLLCISSALPVNKCGWIKKKIINNKLVGVDIDESVGIIIEQLTTLVRYAMYGHQVIFQDSLH